MANTPSKTAAICHPPSAIFCAPLRDVSRSFYLTLRVLPAAIRPQISLAYLLARMTDTIADTEIVPLDLRLKALQALRARILGTTSALLDVGELARQQGSSAERALLERVEEILTVLARFSADDLRRIRDVLSVIASGQELDLQRFAGAGAGRIVSLQTDADLDDYTYRVAGCVGEFWTKMCRAHLFPAAPLDDIELLSHGVRFGKGLQLVNILRDLPRDLRQGRCYLPGERLNAIGLTPADLLKAEVEPTFRSLFRTYLDRAEAHLEAGWAYTNLLPRSLVRVRLACAWPILIGRRTIARLRTGNVLEAGRRIKVSRGEVRNIVLRSVLFYPWPGAWNKLFHRT